MKIYRSFPQPNRSTSGRIWGNEESCLPVTGPHQKCALITTQILNLNMWNSLQLNIEGMALVILVSAPMRAPEQAKYTLPCYQLSQEEVKFFQRKCFNSIREPVRNGVSQSNTETVLQQHVCPLPAKNFPLPPLQMKSAAKQEHTLIRRCLKH